jgi:glycosyltransferase involved in cell wall biosynthesis
MLGNRPLQARQLSAGAATPRALWLAIWSDVVVLVSNGRSLVPLCALKRLLGGRFRLVVVDAVLNRPTGWAGGLHLLLKRWLFRRIDLFILHCRATEEFRRVWGIPEARLVYVPFKVNGYQRVVTRATRDDGFLLACGRSRRDYVTFCAAMESLPLRATILAQVGQATREHGSRLARDAIPASVTLVVDDGSTESWLDWMARSTAVVIPVLPGTLAPAGLSTYLVAMALGKCVIITDSPATRGILTDREAVIVPPSDPEALRAAMTRVAEDATFRQRVAEGGRAYALSLGGDERLVEDVIGQIAKLLRHGSPTQD